VRYEGAIFRPPSEADAYILQATIGCSWNHCVYCDMYREKSFRVRPVADTLEDIATAAARFGPQVRKVFVGDGDALVLDTPTFEKIAVACHTAFPNLERVSCYATARNLLEKSEADLRVLRASGLRRLYIGPESGDDATLKRIAKGATFEEHAEAAARAHAAGMEISVIVMLGVASTERSEEHAHATAALITAMDPEYVAALTTTVVPNTPLAQLVRTARFTLPSMARMFEELRTIVAECNPSRAVFRTNHASNYLPLAGILPKDRGQIVATIDAALRGDVRLRPEWSRGL
jgi:radical SAM superfamily enzyme YgiQ (UPF0313 family)